MVHFGSNSIPKSKRKKPNIRILKKLKKAIMLPVPHLSLIFKKSIKKH